ncbi:MAG: transporter [Pseudomonadota bacterium]
MNRFHFGGALLCAAALLPAAVSADQRADDHAPVGVMGDHFHAKGEWMFSYRFMRMDMQDNGTGTSDVSPDTIVTTVPNAFFGMPGQPPTLRIVPTEMTMDMHMLGFMYAPSDRLTLMAMAAYLENDMDHVTYQGGAGTTVLGNFTTQTSGWGDTRLTALYALIDEPRFRLHAIAGLSLPTGSSDETAEILTPMNMRPTVRTPYPMQLGSGSWDPIVGLSLASRHSRLGWGAQWNSVFRLSDNDDDYRLGHQHEISGWVSWLFSEPASVSLRLTHRDRGNIRGRDPVIMGPVQTADPNRQAFERTEIGLGLNLAGQDSLAGWRLGIEWQTPIREKLDGPQLTVDSSVTVGLQRTFY